MDHKPDLAPLISRLGVVGGRHRTFGANAHRCLVVGRLGLCAGIAAAAWPAAGAAQNIPLYFPEGVSGFDQGLGVTVLSRLRPLYETPGVRVGTFVVSPALDESLFYNSNVTGTAGSGSWGERTAGSVSATSDWERDRLGGTVGFANNQFFSLPGDNFTDWNVGLGGGYTINDGLLEAVYSHQTYHQIGVAIGTTTSQTPVLDQTDTAHLDYTFNFGPYSITPDISASAYRYGAATVLGVQQNQDYLNRNVVAGTITGRYSRSDEGGLLVVLRGVTANYTNPQIDQPTNNSNSIQVLGGLDFQGESVWRYRFLVGVETRLFQAQQYPTRTAPLVEGSAIWTPTGLTTLTGTLSRDIEDPQSPGTNGYTLTQARLVVDHEYLPNVFLQGRAGIAYAQFIQTGGGTQTSYTVGAGATWLVSPRIRLSLNYDYIKQTGNADYAGTSAAGVGSPFAQNLVILMLHFAL
jgi:opacity protein-like surface antigen